MGAVSSHSETHVNVVWSRNRKEELERRRKNKWGLGIILKEVITGIRIAKTKEHLERL